MRIKNLVDESGKGSRNLLGRQKLKNKRSGFTLIEMMVAIAIFAVAIGAISGILIAALRQQRQVLGTQAVLDQGSYFMEYMSRALRLARKELSAGSCLSQSGLNFEITRSGSGIKFINLLQADDCQEFFLENDQVKYRRQIGLAGENTQLLTSGALQVLQLKFYLSGGSQSDDLQPKVTVFAEIRASSTAAVTQTTKIQTSISQRSLDVEY
jgi:prepilin-type N-terminal cleavage/methylation domain-containing protein